MEYTTVAVVAGLVLIWALRKMTTPQPQNTLRAHFFQDQQRGLDDLRLYVTIPILHSVEKDPMLYIVIHEGKRTISILPTLGDAPFPLPEAAVSERVWKELEAMGEKKTGVELHA